MAQISKKKVIFTAVIVLIVAIAGISAVFYPQMGEFFTGQLQLTRLDPIVDEEESAPDGEEDGLLQFHRAAPGPDDGEDAVLGELTQDELRVGETTEPTMETFYLREETQISEIETQLQEEETRLREEEQVLPLLNGDDPSEEEPAPEEQQQMLRTAPEPEPEPEPEEQLHRFTAAPDPEPEPEPEPDPERAPEPEVTCADLDNNLSYAFYSRNWQEYATIMNSIVERGCHAYCMNNFYRTVMYISLSDIVNARIYYRDEQCVDCEMAIDLNAYAAEEYSRIGISDNQARRDILYELTVNNLNYCAPPPPESFNAFINSLVFDAAKYFGQRREAALKNDLQKSLSQILPTAYAQSDAYTDEVEDVIKRAYDDMYGVEEVPECRSLQIIRPEEAVGDMPVVVVPQTGFQNKEIAIQVDTDPGAVNLYRYKSLEGTITFDDQGTVYDTEATSALMNHRDTSKGDIVTVWALDDGMRGIEACNDSFYVELEPPEMAPPPPMAPPPDPEPEPEAVAMTEPSPPAPPPPPPPPAEPTPAEPVFTPVFEPTAPPQPAMHMAAPEGYVAFQASPVQTSETGPAFLYLIGAGLAGAYVKKRVKK